MLQPLDGPSKQLKLSITTSTVVEVKVGTTHLEERKAYTLQPLGGNIYLYYGDETGTPSVATIQDNGFQLVSMGMYTIEASKSQVVYVLAMTGTTNLIVAERA